MRFWTIVKMLAALAVMAVLAFTLIVLKQYFGGEETQTADTRNWTEKLPVKEEVEERVLMLKERVDVANLPDIAPGERAFEAARTLLSSGQFVEAEEKLKYMTSYYPTAPSCGEARRILGEMNMDRLLSGGFPGVVQTYTVKKGDSFYKIARNTETNFDLIMQLNGLKRSDKLYPGMELSVIPLNFHLVIDIPRQELRFMHGDQLIKIYHPTEFYIPERKGRLNTKLRSIEAKVGDKRVNSTKTDYRMARKTLVVKRPLLEICADGDFSRDGFRGVILHAADLEELTLLMRAGNPIEIQY